MGSLKLRERRIIVSLRDRMEELGLREGRLLLPATLPG